MNRSANYVLREMWNSKKTLGDISIAKHSPTLFKKYMFISGLPLIPYETSEN